MSNQQEKIVVGINQVTGESVESLVLRKELFVPGPNDNILLAGYVRVWLDNGTSNLLSPAECGRLGIAIPEVVTPENDVEKQEESAPEVVGAEPKVGPAEKQEESAPEVVGAEPKVGPAEKPAENLPDNVPEGSV